MTKIKALWLTLKWIKASVTLVCKANLVWGIQTTNVEDYREAVKTSPLQFEYARVERMREQAEKAWSGK